MNDLQNEAQIVGSPQDKHPKGAQTRIDNEITMARIGDAPQDEPPLDKRMASNVMSKTNRECMTNKTMPKTNREFGKHVHLRSSKHVPLFSFLS